MKVLHLLQSNRFSGAENVVCQIIGMMKDEPGMEMVYCSSNGPIKDALAERGIRFIPLNNFSVDELRDILEEEKPDIIHAHDMRASFYAAKACGKIPLISHIHNNAFDSRGISPKSIAYMLAAIKAKHIFWVSQSSYRGYAFHKLFRKKSSVLYNIIDVDELYRKMQRDSHKYDYDVIYVGRLTYQKDPHRLMRVLEKVVKKLPCVKIGIVGTGDLEEETRSLCNELALENNVHFLGFQSNPLKMLHDAKVMIMTSRWEGTPMCALEAMALGVPIVSTPTDGLCELVADDITGYLSDRDEVLAQKVIDTVTSGDLHSRLSESAKKRATDINNVSPYKKSLLAAYKR